MMMKIYDESIEINHNPNRSYIPDHPYIILLLVAQDQEKLMYY